MTTKPKAPSRFERDREMVNNPMGWPQMRLPMKNPGRLGIRSEGSYLDLPSLGWLFTGVEWPGDERTV